MTGVVMLVVGLALFLAGFVAQLRWRRAGLAVMALGALVIALGFGLSGLAS